MFAQGILRQRQSADAPAGACTLRADMESAPTVYTKDCNNDKGSWRGQAPLQNRRLRGCVGANSVRPCNLAAVQDCPGRRGRRPLRPTRKLASAGAGPFVGQNDGRQPAELAHSCGSMPHWGIDRCATPQQRASAPTERGRFGPGGVNAEGSGKALRKMQHSCIF